MNKTYVCELEGKQLRTERDATDLISEALSQGADLVVVPTARLDDDFFRLKTRVLGEFIQKFVTYRLRLAIVGDISQHMAESDSLRDFVYESNQGAHILFAPSLEDLKAATHRSGEHAPSPHMGTTQTP
jgi:hypothetical protein